MVEQLTNDPKVHGSNPSLSKCWKKFLKFLIEKRFVQILDPKPQTERRHDILLNDTYQSDSQQNGGSLFMTLWQYL
jgi:hypothetical protein